MCEQPLISIDVVALRRGRDGAIEFALHERPFDPYAGALALPGVLLGPGESVREAAYRALDSKLGVPRDRVRYLTQSSVADETNRDPRGATISIVFIAVVESDGSRAKWFRIMEDEVPTLPFDHDAILSGEFENVHFRLWSDWSLTAAILGEEFTTTQALSISLALGKLPSDPSNLSRWLNSCGHVRKVEGWKSPRGRDTLWAWT